MVLITLCLSGFGALPAEELTVISKNNSNAIVIVEALVEITAADDYFDRESEEIRIRADGVHNHQPVIPGELLKSKVLTHKVYETSSSLVMRKTVNNYIFIIDPFLAKTDRWPLNRSLPASLDTKSLTVKEAAYLLETKYGQAEFPDDLIERHGSEILNAQVESVRELAVSVASRLNPDVKFFEIKPSIEIILKGNQLSGKGMIPWCIHSLSK